MKDLCVLGFFGMGYYVFVWVFCFVNLFFILFFFFLGVGGIFIRVILIYTKIKKVNQKVYTDNLNIYNAAF